MKKLILASSSKYRKDLLTRLGVDFSCQSPDIDEDAYKQKIQNPIELAQTLSEVKARAIFELNPDSVVIGSDQLACIDDQILGKAGTVENARKQLQALQGKTHYLITAVTICSDKDLFMFYDKTCLRMKQLSDSQINFYLSLDNPIDCAGSYKLEQYGIGLFEEIKSEDHTAIVGLPLLKTSQYLAAAGIPVFSKQ